MKTTIELIVLTSALAAWLAAPVFADDMPVPDALADMRPSERLAGDLEQSTGTIVLLHFWASWCLPCRAEMAELAQFRHDGFPALAEKGLRVITVSNDVRDLDLENFAENVDLAFPLYYDPLSELAGRYGIRGLPATVVVDSNGIVLEQILGAQQWSSPVFQGKLWTLLRQNADQSISSRNQP